MDGFCESSAVHCVVLTKQWRCGESNPGPRVLMKESLRRVVSVTFKAGCEERRRHHSCSIPYLDASVGSPRIDPTEDSTSSRAVGAGREQMSPRRAQALNASCCVGERNITNLTEVRRFCCACKSVLGKFVFSLF